MSDDEEIARACLLAHRELHGPGKFVFDLVSLTLSLPDRRLGIGDYYDLVHECVHAQLTDSVLGMALNGVTELCGCVEKRLFPRLDDLLQQMRPSKGVRESLFYRLFVNAHPRPTRDEFFQLAPLVQDASASRWRQLEHDDCFSADTAMFLRLRGRRDAVLSEWRTVHEGLAVFATESLCKEGGDDLTLLLRRTLPLIPREKGATPVEQLVRELRDYASNKPNEILPPKYRRGYRLIRRVAATALGKYGAWIAALAASHFPYQACDLVDLDDSDFQQWLTVGGLATEQRLKRLADNGKTVDSAAHELRNSGFLSNETKRRVLQTANGGDFPLPLRRGYERFATWEKGVIWRSKAAMEHHQRHGYDIDKVGLENLDALDDDRTINFGLTDDWHPPLLWLEDGRITAASTDEQGRAERRFVNAYEIERTAAVFDWLHSVFD